MSMHGNNNGIYKSTRTWKNMNANVAFIGPCNRA